MLTQHRATTETGASVFLSQAGVELNRAERYRVFVSLSVLDLEPFRDMLGNQFEQAVETLVNDVRGGIRACDYVALMGPHCLAVLFPETSRQEAETAAKRTAELIRRRVSELSGEAISETIPVEIASYPDTAGAKALGEFLRELTDKSQN